MHLNKSSLALSVLFALTPIANSATNVSEYNYNPNLSSKETGINVEDLINCGYGYANGDCDSNSPSIQKGYSDSRNIAVGTDAGRSANKDTSIYDPSNTSSLGINSMDDHSGTIKYNDTKDLSKQQSIITDLYGSTGSTNLTSTYNTNALPNTQGLELKNLCMQYSDEQLPDYLQTPDLVFHAVSKEPLILQFVRDDLRLFYICKAAVQKNWEAIKYVPKDIIDEDIIDLALKDSSAFILDLVEHSQITSEIYVKQLMAFPTDGATHLITTHLVENIDKLKELIYLIENLDSYAPQFIFKNCDPKILSHNSKHEALCGLLQVKPEWIQYLDNCIIDTDIFKIAMNKGIDLKLDAINYKKEFFEIIFYANKKAYLNVPKSRFNSIGSARIKATIIEAIDEGWINEVPNYFFTYEILEDDDLRDLLSQHREETALIKQNVLDFDKLLNANCSACEYSLLHTKIPSSIVEQFMSKHVDAYAGLEDSDKTLEFTKAFLKEYPNQISHIPSKFRNNEEVMRDLVADNFHLNRYLSTNDMLMINS